MVMPGIIDNLKTLVTAFIEEGPNVLMGGAVVSFLGQVLTAQQFEEIMNTIGLERLLGHLDINKTALEAYADK